jgi:hypothetical protein
MGKRNSVIQQTAPANGTRKSGAKTINVDELQGSAQPTGNVQPQSVTVGSGPKLGTGRRQNQIGNTQLGQLGTAAGSAIGSGPSNNGFVAATANID